jgi:MFS family permease
MTDRLPPAIVAIGFVSLFMDVSSEMIHGLLPLFLTVTLGASAATVGLIEGLGEATGQIVRVFSGTISDRTRRRKPLAVAGYGLSALTKPLFALAGSPVTVAAARFADRVGKGIRGAPRDALVADLVPPDRRGAAFGLRQSMDTIGAFAGPLVAMAVMALSQNDIRLVFWLAILPALIAVAILVLAVREPPPAAAPATAPRPRLDRASMAALGRGFWVVTVIACAMTFARISEAFLILRASDAGLPLALAPIVLVVMNVVYAASAWPAGVLSDRIGRRGILIAGFALLALAEAVLGLGGGLPSVAIGIALWGLHMGLTQGLLSAEVAARAPAHLRGTAFGCFSLATGVTLLLSNTLAGMIWESAGAGTAFLTAAAVAAAGTLALALQRA